MTKQDFLDQLREKLAGLSTEEREAALEYYEDFFNDADGETEEEVIARLGTPDSVAQTILGEMPESAVPAPVEPPRQAAGNRFSQFPPWALILMAIGFFSVGLPVITGIGGGLIGLVAGIAGLYFGLLFAVGGIFLAGAALFYKGLITSFGALAVGLMQMGCGLIAMGLSLMLIIPAVWLTLYIGKHIVRFIVALFDRILGRRKHNEKDV